MPVGLETYNIDGTVGLSANGSYGVFTERYEITAGTTIQIDYPIPGIYQKWLGGRTIVLRFNSSGASSLDPKSNDTVSIYNGENQRLFVMEW